MVTASGEIKPRNYINIGANAGSGRLTEILVKEGDRVRKGQLLATHRNRCSRRRTWPRRRRVAEFRRGRLGRRRSRRSRRPTRTCGRRRLASTGPRRTLERATLNFERAKQLFKDKLIAQQDFDQRKAAYDSAQAARARGRVAAGAGHARSARRRPRSWPATQKRIAQVQATLTPRHRRAAASTIRRRAARRRGHQPAGARRRDRGARHPELPGQPDHDHRRHVADHRRGEGGRDRHRQREAGPGGRHHHRRDSEQDLQGARDRDRQHGHSALHRPGRLAERHLQPGSQGFQGGDRAGQSARRRSARASPARPRSPRPRGRRR